MATYYEMGTYKWVVFVSTCTPCMAADKAIENYLYCRVVPSPQPRYPLMIVVLKTKPLQMSWHEVKSNKLGYIAFGKLLLGNCDDIV